MIKHIKILIILIFELFIFGCAHSRLLSWKENEFTVCCNKWCNENDWKKATSEYCDGTSTFISDLAQSDLSSARGVASIETKSVGNWNTRLITQNEKCQVFNCSGNIK